MNTAVKLIDENLTVIKLQRGSYMVDGKRVDIQSSGHVPVNDINTVTKLTETKVISHYIHVDDETNIMKPSDYTETLLDLKSKGDSDYDQLTFNDLDDEYNYKKFIRSWSTIYKEIQTESDPLEFEVIKTVLDSGNPFITSMFANGIDSDVFVYDRASAVLDIVSKKFKSLGMVYDDRNLNYESTKNKKVWSNSSHSVITYVVAFGKYVFGDKWQIKNVSRGTLKSLRGIYNNDKMELESIIDVQYKLHFENVKIDDVKLSEMYSKFKTLRSIIMGIDSKVKTEYKKSHALKVHSEIVELFDSLIKGD